MLTFSDLHDYQKAAAEEIVHNEHYALWHDLGLGKTVTTLTGIAHLKSLGEAKNVLVVAPPFVAKNNWHTEIKKWSFLHSTFKKVNVCVGAPNTRRMLLDDDADLHILSNGSFLWLVKEYGKTWKWDMLVWDESQALRNMSSKRTKKVRVICQGQKHWGRGTNKGKVVGITKPLVKRAVFLTATPATNGLLNLWSQMACLDDGESLGKNYNTYRDKYFKLRPKSDPAHEIYIIKSRKYEAAIHKSVEHLTHVLRARDYLSMPDITYSNYVVNMPQDAMDLYKELERSDSCVVQDGNEIVANGPASANIKLLQIANGASYVGDPEDMDFVKGKWSKIHDAKIQALKEIREATKGSTNLLVAGWFKHDFVRIHEAFPEAERISDANISRWNSGEIPIMTAHPMSAGAGLNLQDGGHTIVFFSLFYDLEKYLQFIGRVHRQGQKYPVSIVHIVCKDTKELDVATALREKDEVQLRLLENLAR